MEVSYVQVESIVKTLPVSFYLGEGIDIDLIDNPAEEEAFFNPITRIITLNYDKMKYHFINMEDNWDIEQYIRSDLYHEISHVFMTPERFYDNHKYTPYHPNKVASALNIFEDERMETILYDFYYGVDFKESIIIMNNYKGEDAQDARSDFYYTVRFRHGKDKFLKQVEYIINENPRKHINAKKCYESEVGNYKNSIITLMEDIYREWYEEHSMDKILEMAPNYKSFSIEGKNKIIAKLDQEENPVSPEQEITIHVGETEFNDMIKGMNPKTGQCKNGVKVNVVVHKDDKDPKNGKDGESGKDKEKDTKGETGKGKKGKEDKDTDKEPTTSSGQEKAKKQKEKWLNTYQENFGGTKRSEVQEMIAQDMNQFVDQNLTKSIGDIFEEFVHKTKNNGSATQRYSGTFNPRMVGREDWRVWTYKDDHGPVRGYDLLHINLFIDTSGSFCHNEDKVNTLLRSLLDLEKKFKFFTFDLVTCQVGETLKKKNERYIQCYGGNDLDDKVWDIYKRLQLKNAYNVNIALFDGNAFTDSYSSKHPENFKVFNNARNSIISDTDNKTYIERYCPSSHNIFVPRSGSSTYPNLLFENILKSINVALK